MFTNKNICLFNEKLNYYNLFFDSNINLKPIIAYLIVYKVPTMRLRCLFVLSKEQFIQKNKKVITQNPKNTI